MLPTCPFTRSEGFSIELFGVQNNSANKVFTASRVTTVTYIPWRERELVSLSLSVSLRSLATTNINVVTLSLVGRSLSWLLTCVAFHLSRVACEFGSKSSALLVCLSTFSLTPQPAEAPRVSPGWPGRNDCVLLHPRARALHRWESRK